VLETQRTINVVALQPLPWLVGALAGIGSRRQLDAGRQEDAALERAYVALEVAEIRVDTRAVAAVVEAEGERQPFGVLVVDGRVAGIIRAARAQTEANGAIVANVKNFILAPTSYSSVK